MAIVLVDVGAALLVSFYVCLILFFQCLRDSANSKTQPPKLFLTFLSKTQLTLEAIPFFSKASNCRQFFLQQGFTHSSYFLSSLGMFSAELCFVRDCHHFSVGVLPILQDGHSGTRISSGTSLNFLLTERSLAPLLTTLPPLTRHGKAHSPEKRITLQVDHFVCYVQEHGGHYHAVSQSARYALSSVNCLFSVYDEIFL